MSNKGMDIEEADAVALFNFRWKRGKLNRLRTMAAERGVTASAIVKGLLLHEFEREDSKHMGVPN